MGKLKMRGRRLFDGLLDVLYPRCCPVCREVLGAASDTAAQGSGMPCGRRVSAEEGVICTGTPAQRLSVRECAPPSETKHFEEDGTEKRNAAPRWLSGDGIYRYICAECLPRISWVGEGGAEICAKCGKELAGNPASSAAEETGIDSSAERLCADCTEQIRRFVRCCSLVNYDGTAREIMAQIKYHHKKEFMDFFAYAAVRRFGAELCLLRPDALIPVPVHPERRRMRGYNQAEVLADGIGRALGIPVAADVLVRTKRTAAQKELNRASRALNLQNAFCCTERLRGESGAARYQRVVLIDDIYTTGATMEACTEALLAGGVGAVYGLCACAGRDV